MKGVEVSNTDVGVDRGRNSDGGILIRLSAQGEVCSIRVAFYQMLKEGQPIRLSQGWCLNFQLPYCHLLICCIGAADRLYLSAQIYAHRSFDIGWSKSIPVHIKCFICKVQAENLNEMSPRLSKMILHSWRIKHGVSLIVTEGRWTRFFFFFSFKNGNICSSL